MPPIPLPPTDPAKQEKNVKEQYESLGKFVEAFELMVDEVRSACIDRTWSAITEATELEFDKQFQERKRLLEIPFHHQNVGAKILWDMMRAILAEIISKPDNSHHADYDTFKRILSFMEREFSDLCNKRNELLHGTWLIGYVSTDDPDSSKFRLRKFKTTADGLEEVAPHPQDVTVLAELTKRCDQLRTWVAEVEFCLRRDWPVSKHFKLEGKKWFHRLRPSSDEWTTFPDKHA